MGHCERLLSTKCEQVRWSNVLQIQPGVKDIRTALANALAEGQETSGTLSPSEGGMNERQGLGSFSGLNTPVGGQSTASYPFGGPCNGPTMHRPRSIRRLMSEKSIAMDTVYSGMVLESDVPSEPLEVRKRCAMVADRIFS